MQTETPQSPNPETTAPSPAAATSKTEAPRTQNRALRKPTLALAGVALLALGTLLGIGASRHLTGVAMAAPEAAKSAQVTPTTVASPARAPETAQAWNPFQELRDMQRRMDRMFDSMSSQLRLEPRLSLFQDNPGYSLSLRVQDLKDHYEVRAYLPDAKASDVNVNLIDKQTLKVQVSNKTAEASGQPGASQQVTEWGEFAQVIQLPSPVKDEQMRIDRPNHELIVTLPKA